MAVAGFQGKCKDFRLLTKTDIWLATTIMERSTAYKPFGKNRARQFIYKDHAGLALAFGGAAQGVSWSTLKAQRRLVVTVSSPGNGTAGQDLDMALILADGSPQGRAVKLPTS